MFNPIFFATLEIAKSSVMLACVCNHAYDAHDITITEIHTGEDSQIQLVLLPQC